MANELAPRQAQTSALARPVSAGTGADVNELTFGTTTILDYTELPATFPTGTALTLANTTPTPPTPAPAQGRTERAVASIARQHPKPFRLTDGTIVQRRTAWEAHPDRIITSTAERPLTPNPNGTLSPNGPWSLTRRATQALPDRAKRTVGTAPSDPTKHPHSTPAATSGGAASDDYAHERERFPEGATALAYLPAQVRRSLYARIPTPTRFDGLIAQRQDDHAIEVHILRATPTTSVVVKATKDANATTWNITMLTYDFPQPATIEGRP